MCTINTCLCVYLCIVCMCVCCIKVFFAICMCVHICVSVQLGEFRLYVCMWRSEVNIRVFLHYSIHCLRNGWTHTSPFELSWPANEPQNPPVSIASDLQHNTWLFLSWIWTQIFMLAQQTFYPQGHLPCPWLISLKAHPGCCGLMDCKKEKNKRIQKRVCYCLQERQQLWGPSPVGRRILSEVIRVDLWTR